MFHNGINENVVFCQPLYVNHANSVNHVNGVISVNSLNSVNCVNSVNSVNSVSILSAVLPPSVMLFFNRNDNTRC